MQNVIQWAGSNSSLKKFNGDSIKNSIPEGIWKVADSQQGPYLTKIAENFNFNYKLYGVNEAFIQHAMKSYTHAEKNLGILLNGLKGGGKTVTAKIIANRSGLTTILIDSSNIHLLWYFEEVEQPLCFMVDEFEKIARHDNKEMMSQMLTFVDGSALSSKHLFIFTSNETDINKFFIDRPGRIRYIKPFDSLELETVKEIIEDLLIYKEYKKDLIENVIYFKFLTIDMLIAIIKEINIHNMPFSDFKDFFNVNNDKPMSEVSWKITDTETGESFITDCLEKTSQSIYDFCSNIDDNDDSISLFCTLKAKEDLEQVKRDLDRPSLKSSRSGYINSYPDFVEEDDEFYKENKFVLIGEFHNVFFDDNRVFYKEHEIFENRLYTFEPIFKVESLYNTFAF